jgi:hypothetical protein
MVRSSHVPMIYVIQSLFDTLLFEIQEKIIHFSVHFILVLLILQL